MIFCLLKITVQENWDEGETLQNEGNDKISQANILKTQTDDLKALIEQYNQQVNDYNSCMAQ